MLSATKSDSSTQAVVAKYVYGYDLQGNRTSEQIGQGVKSTAYNQLDQPTGTTGGGPVQLNGKTDKPTQVTVNGTAATEDSNNNFSGTTALTAGTNTVTIVANDYDGNSASNKYSLIVPPATGSAPAFDANGNMTQDSAGNTYQWDAKDEMVGITYAAGGNTAFTYDGLGRRVKIVETNASGTVTSTKQFIWLGSGIAEERDASNTVQKRFYAQGEQIASTSYYYTGDHLGSVREMTDSSGAIQARYDYDPYGRATQVQGTLASDFQYAGYYVHAASGLNLTKFRAYDPNAGRWLSRDPAGVGISPNLYAYVGNCPSSFIDRTGLCSNSLSTAQDIALIIAVAAAVASLILLAAFFAPYILAYLLAFDFIAAVLTELTFAVSPIVSLLGFDAAGFSLLVGDTYYVFAWGLFRTAASQGMRALLGLVVSRAESAGASRIVIVGLSLIIKEGESLATVNPGVWARLGFQLISNAEKAIVLLKNL